MSLPRIAFACSLLWLSPARGEDGRPKAQLSYSVSDDSSSCPSQEELEGAVAARLGYVPFHRESPTLVSVVITRDGTSYRAHLEVTRPNEEVAGRDLTSATGDCEELGRSLALAVSVAIDPMSLTRSPGVAPQPEPPPEGEPEPEPEKAPEPAPTKPARAEAPPSPSPAEPAKSKDKGPEDGHAFSQAWFLRASARGNLGLTPKAGPGFALALGKRFKHFQIALEPSWDLPTQTSREDGGAVSGQVWLAAAEVCGVASWLHYCGVIAGGGYRGEGMDVDSPTTAVTAYGATGPRLLVAFPVQSTVRFIAGATALVSLTPTHLRLDGDSVFTTAPVAAILQVGAETSFF